MSKLVYAKISYSIIDSENKESAFLCCSLNRKIKMGCNVGLEAELVVKNISEDLIDLLAIYDNREETITIKVGETYNLLIKARPRASVFHIKYEGIKIIDKPEHTYL